MKFLFFKCQNRIKNYTFWKRKFYCRVANPSVFKSFSSIPVHYKLFNGVILYLVKNCMMTWTSQLQTYMFLIDDTRSYSSIIAAFDDYFTIKIISLFPGSRLRHVKILCCGGWVLYSIIQNLISVKFKLFPSTCKKTKNVVLNTFRRPTNG